MFSNFPSCHDPTCCDTNFHRITPFQAFDTFSSLTILITSSGLQSRASHSLSNTSSSTLPILPFIQLVSVGLLTLDSRLNSDIDLMRFSHIKSSRFILIAMCFTSKFIILLGLHIVKPTLQFNL